MVYLSVSEYIHTLFRRKKHCYWYNKHVHLGLHVHVPTAELLTRAMRLGIESLFFLLAIWLAVHARMTCDLTWTCNKILVTWLGLGANEQGKFIPFSSHAITLTIIRSKVTYVGQMRSNVKVYLHDFIMVDCTIFVYFFIIPNLH